jgi:hypothetical protein
MPRAPPTASWCACSDAQEPDIRAKTAFSVLAIVAILAVALLVAAYRALYAGIGCSTTQDSERWSADRAYKATLLLKYCSNAVGGDALFWTVRVDKPEPTASGGWFMVWEIENDKAFASDPPAVRWEDAHTLKVDVRTDRLRGELTSQIRDLIVVRRFSPAA